MPSERMPSGSGNSLKGQNQDVNNAQDIIAASGVEAGATSTPDSSVTTPADISSSPRNAETADPADMVYGYGSPSEPSVDNVPAIPLENNETSTVDDTAEVQHTPDVDSDYERKKEEAIRRLPTVDRFVYDMVRYVELSREDIEEKGPYNDLASSSIDALRKAIEIAKGNPVSLKDDVHNKFLVRAVMNSQIVESLLKDVASEERLSDQKRAENQFKIDVLEGLLEKVDNGYHSRQPVGIDIPKKGPQGGASAESANELLGKLRESVQNPEGRVDSSSSTNANLPPSIPTSRRVDSSSSTSRGESFSGDNSVDLSSVPPEVRSQIDKIEQLIKDPRLSGVEKLDLMHEKQKILSGYSHESKLQSGVDTGARGSMPSGESYSSSPEDDFHTNLMGAILGNLHRGMSRNRQGANANANANANAETTSGNDNENENKEKSPEQAYKDSLSEYAKLLADAESKGDGHVKFFQKLPFFGKRFERLKKLDSKIEGFRKKTKIFDVETREEREVKLATAGEALKKAVLELVKSRVDAKRKNGEYSGTEDEINQQMSDDMFDGTRQLLDINVREAVNNILESQLHSGMNRLITPIGRFVNPEKKKKTAKVGVFAAGAFAGVTFGRTLSGVGWPITSLVSLTARGIVKKGARNAAVERNLAKHRDEDSKAVAMHGDEVFSKLKERHLGNTQGNAGEAVANIANIILETQRGSADVDADRADHESRMATLAFSSGWAIGAIATAITEATGLFDGDSPEAPGAGGTGAHPEAPGAGGAGTSPEAPGGAGANASHGIGNGGAGSPDAINVPEPDFSEYDHPWNWAFDNFGEYAESKLYELADMAKQNGYDVEWHGSGVNRWLSVNGDSNPAYVIKVLNKFVKK